MRRLCVVCRLYDDEIWPRLCRRCRGNYSLEPTVGVWSAIEWAARRARLFERRRQRAKKQKRSRT